MSTYGEDTLVGAAGYVTLQSWGGYAIKRP